MKLLWLDDVRNPMEDDWLVFSPIPKNSISEVIWVKSYHEFTDWINQNGLPDGICFDHDLGVRLVLNSSKASDGMKISFNFILTFFTFASFVLAVIMPSTIRDNLVFIFLIVSISVQILIAVVPKYFTAISNSNK